MRKMEIETNSYSMKNRRYLGSKTRLLPFIHDTFEKENISFESLLDIFGGTGVVSESFNDQCKIIINDLLESNRVSYNAFLGSEKIDVVKINKIIDGFNNIENPKENYFSENFSDTFFSKENCLIIGTVRQEIEDLFLNKAINKREKDILLTSLLYSADRIANTVGHYDAFRRGADLSKKIAFKKLDLPEISLNKGNEIYKMDANELAKQVYADVVYIDPPYNSRQYCDAYHLLENLALWNKPKVYGAAKKMDRSNLKSKYCENSAPRVFDDLISKLNCKYIVVSYNNMGLKGAGRSQAKITDTEIIRSLEKRGDVVIYETDFNQFTVGKTSVEDHKERLFICKVGEFKKQNSNIEINGNAKSPINYTGGKFKILKDLLAKFPEGQYDFVDLFGGGFNVGPNVPYTNVFYNEKSEHVYRLINLFCKYDGKTILGKLDFLINKYELSDSELNGYEFYKCNSDNGLGPYNKKGFALAKKDYNAMRKSVEKDFLLLLLTIYSFNNQIRFNSSGDYNMPVGKRDLNSSTRKNILMFCEKIKTKTVVLSNLDFEKFDYSKLNNPFFYCDPPYLITDATYNESGGWTEKDEKRLLKFLSDLNSKQIPFALSNVLKNNGKENKILLQWALENNFNINYIKKDYNNCIYQKKNNGKTVEVLITNY